MSIDSSCLNIEALVTSIYDDWYNLNSADPKKLNRTWFTALVTVIIWVASFPYYLNTGPIWQDIMDYFLFSFIGPLLTVM